MFPDGSLQSIGSHTQSLSSNWHSIRPWAPILSLAVREITSVSATFILSSSLSGEEIDPRLASLGLEAAEEDPAHGEEGSNRNASGSSSAERKASSVIADALAKGLSVNVNGSAWPRAFIRIDDQLDEAVIIIYALMPGRQYDIELGLAHAGQPNTLRRQVTTEDDSDNDTTEIHTDPESPSLGNSALSDPHSTPSTSPSRTVPGTPPTADPQVTLEEKLGQLQRSLSAVNAERETLLASLKSARRDAQKADSALRSEIDTLKRTSEKNAAAELRGKQKVLALQEAVKRAQNATRETEETAKEVEGEVPELTKRKEEKESEHTSIKAEAEKVRKEREEMEEKGRKKLEAMKAELAGLTNKLERLGGKREKMESTAIPDLEEKLKDVEKEIEIEEEELATLEMEESQARTQNLTYRTQIVEDSSLSYVPFQRPRYHSAGDKPGPIGRPSPAPIHRPHTDSATGAPPGLPQSVSSPIWSPGHVHRQATHPVHSHQQAHNPRSQSMHNHTNHTNHNHHITHTNPSHSHSPPILLLNQRRASLKSTTLSLSSTSASNMSTLSGVSSATPASLSSLSTSVISTSASATSSPTSLTSSPTRTSPSAVAATSTLSSRAPAFEPSRSIGGVKGVNVPAGVTTTTTMSGPGQHVPSPIQRPSAGTPVPVGSGRPGGGGVSRNGSANGHGHQWAGMHGHGHGH